MSLSKSLLAVGVSVLLVNKEGKILLSERTGTSHASGMLSTPGGRIEEHETRFDCAVREFREECGAELDPDSLTDLGFREHFRFDMHYFMCYIKATKWSGDIINAEPDKHKDWEWHDPLTVKVDTCTEPAVILQKLRKTDVQRNIASIRQKLIASDIVLLDQIDRRLQELEQMQDKHIETLMNQSNSIHEFETGTAVKRCIL